MTMVQKQATGRELVEKWVHQNQNHGKRIDQIVGTLFVYGNEMFTLYQGEEGVLGIESKQVPVVIFRKMDELHKPNICRACGLEHSSHKEAVQCCINNEE